ncbi:hypothetical protein Tco_1179699 [Tanacetum coccineum]
MEGSEQSHSVSSGTVPDPQDLERDIQLASTRLPSTLDEGTRKSQPLPEGTKTNPKDSVGNKQPIDKGLPSMDSDEGTTKTTSHLEGPLGDKDSGGHIPPANMEPIHHTVTNLLGTDVRAFLLSDDEAQESEEEILGADKPTSSTALYTEASDSDSSSDDLLKKYDNTLPLTERQLIKYLRKVSTVLFNRITEESIKRQQDQIDKLVKASLSSLVKSHTATIDLYKGLNVITKLLKEINNAVKDDPAMNKKISEATESFPKISTNIIEVLSLVKGFNFSNLQSSMNALQAHALKQDEDLLLGPNPLPTWHEILVSESQAGDQRKLVKASSIIRHDLDAPVLVPYTINKKLHYLTNKQIQEYLDKEEKIRKAKEEARLLAMTTPEVIKVVQEEAEKIGLDPKTIKSAKAGEKFMKAQDAEHQVFKRKHTGKVKKSLELRKHKYDNYIGTDGRNFDVQKPFDFGEFGISELDELREIIPRKKNAVVKDLMNSLRQRYERIRKIPKELGIPSALPAPIPEHASSKSLRRKRKHIELEPEI